MLLKVWVYKFLRAVWSYLSKWKYISFLRPSNPTMVCMTGVNWKSITMIEYQIAIKNMIYWVWWCIPLNSALRRMRKEDWESRPALATTYWVQGQLELQSETLSQKKTKTGDVFQQYSACLACLRPWVWSLAPKTKTKTRFNFFFFFRMKGLAK
jgi:hypothetical protein